MVTIFFAVVGVVFYTVYSRKSTEISGKSVNTTLSAILIYLIAALMLFLGSGLATLYWRGAWINFDLPNTTHLWAYRLGITKANTLLDIGISIIIMAICYAISIGTEMRSRRDVNIATFDIAYQLNAVVVVALSPWFSIQSLEGRDIIGCILVFIASLAPVSIRFPKLSIWTVISGVSCGVALLTDSNITKQVIFYPQFSWEHTPIFIFYEAVTFFLPFVLTLTYYYFGRWQSDKKVHLWSEIKVETKQIKNYTKAALYSAFYFVCSVFALSVNDSIVIASVIFTTIPFINVWFDPKSRSKFEKKIEYTASIVLIVGLLLIAHII